MRKGLIFLASLLWATMSMAQVNISLPPGNNKAVTEEWVKQQVDEWLKRLHTTPPNDGPVITPDTGRANCPAQPAIPAITNITPTSINVGLSAVGVTRLNWFIYKTSAPLLYLKTGTVQYAQSMSLAWTGELPAGDYGLKLEAVNCNATTTRTFIIQESSQPIPCSSGPSVTSISSFSKTGLTFSWSGLNVPEVIWNVRLGNTTVRSGSFIPGSSQTQSVTFASIGAGTYELQLIGLTCTTIQPGRQFTIVETVPGNPSSAGRQFVMNFTGYGFDPSQSNGLDPEWVQRAERFANMTYQGVNFKGIDGIRVNVKWFDYQPTDNVYRDDKILAALNWCVQRGLKLSIAIIPWRREGDNMFTDQHKARLANGQIWHMEGDLPTTYKTYQPSLHSPIAQQKFRDAVKHLAQVLKQANANYVDYISTATAQTEEYQLIRQESPLIMSGYADIDKQLWATYSSGAPVPYANSSDVNVINQMMDSPNGKKWYEFHTEGLRDFHAQFVRGVREGGMRACGMYAGIGAPSAVYDFTYKLNTIYSAGTSDQPDLIYSSEGDAGTQMSKQMATDLNVGTFPGAEPCIEFDPEDVAANQVRNPPYGVDLNGNILYEHAKSFFRRGGKVVHFAMSFHPDKINQLAEAMYKLRQEFITSSSGMTSIDQGSQINFPITRYSGLQDYRQLWSSAGGGLNKQVKIKLEGTTVTDPGSGGNDPGTGNPGGGGDLAATYQLIMGTTGSGFEHNATHGITDEWVERIEAFKYSWGYGITGICLWIPWDKYERTPGVYEVAALQRAIQFCRERGLTFSVAFAARRAQNDGFIQTNEIITGSAGGKYFEGPEGIGAIYAGYANDRVHGLMKGAIQSIAKAMTTYDKSFYVSLAGGGAGEQVNYVWGSTSGVRQVADISPDNLNRYEQQWRAPRNLAPAGMPPFIQGPGIDWPHPNYNDPKGLEFGRWTTYGIYKANKALVDAVKSVSNLKTLYFYSVTSNLQFRAIQNPNFNFIAQPNDGMYGSDGTSLGELAAKIKVNSINLGTFPNGISATEIDPEDLTHYQGPGTPPYCDGNLDYGAFLQTCRNAFSRGLQVMHYAMAFCPSEIRAFEPSLKILHQEYLGKPYVRPTINASNTVTVEVTHKYRNSIDLMEGVDYWNKYTKYTDNDFWGIRPEQSQGPSNNQQLTTYLDNNAGVYQNNLLVDVKKSGQGSIYTYTRGQYNRDQQLPVMSLSKSVVGAVLLSLRDAGLVNIDATVGSYIPSWNTGQKAAITIKQVISHRSGIRDETAYDGNPTLASAVDAMANSPLDFTPGSQFKYSTTSYQVLARIAEIVTGKPWKQVFNERIRDKCGMGNAEFNPRGPGPVYGNPDNPNAGYGLYCTQNEYSNFFAMLRDNGMYNGQQVLSPTSMNIMFTNQSAGLSNWGFGIILNDNGNEPTSESAKGCYAFINRAKGYSCVLFTQGDYNLTIGTNIEFRNRVRAVF